MVLFVGEEDGAAGDARRMADELVERDMRWEAEDDGEGEADE